MHLDSRATQCRARLLDGGLRWRWGSASLARSAARLVTAGRKRQCWSPSLPGASLWLLTLGGLRLCLWRRRWRLAGLPVIMMALLLSPGPEPDLLMSEDGRVLGRRDGHGTIQIASQRTDRFVTDSWALKANAVCGDRAMGAEQLAARRCWKHRAPKENSLSGSIQETD